EIRHHGESRPTRDSRVEPDELPPRVEDEHGAAGIPDESRPMSHRELEHRATRCLSHGLPLVDSPTGSARHTKGVMWGRSRTVKEPSASSHRFAARLCTRMGPASQSASSVSRPRFYRSVTGSRSGNTDTSKGQTQVSMV